MLTWTGVRKHCSCLGWTVAGILGKTGCRFLVREFVGVHSRMVAEAGRTKGSPRTLPCHEGCSWEGWGCRAKRKGLRWKGNILLELTHSWRHLRLSRNHLWRGKGHVVKYAKHWEQSSLFCFFWHYALVWAWPPCVNIAEKTTLVDIHISHAGNSTQSTAHFSSLKTECTFLVMIFNHLDESWLVTVHPWIWCWALSRCIPVVHAWARPLQRCITCNV